MRLSAAPSSAKKHQTTVDDIILTESSLKRKDGEEAEDDGAGVIPQAINMSSNDLTNSHISTIDPNRIGFVSESIMAKKGRYATEARMKANRTGMFGKHHKNTVVVK